MSHLRHLLVTFLLLGCTDAVTPDDSDTDDASSPTCADLGGGGPRDDVLGPAAIQGLGTHNSYHLRPDALFDPSHDYELPPLDVQADLGVRAFELDLHLTSDDRWEVFHLPGIDPETTCLALEDCLGLLRAWSRAHPCHSPLMVWLEPKDEIDASVAGYQSWVGREVELDDALRTLWPDRRVEPDDVRRGEETVAAGLAAGGWPTLGALRGHVIFAMLDSSEHRDAYLDGAPGLQGRAMFVDGDSIADPFAATFKIDNAIGGQADVRAALDAGFLTTSNVDGPEDSAEDNAAKQQGSLVSGTSWLATNFPAAVGDPSGFSMPEGAPVRCNPYTTTPDDCVATDVEDPDAPTP